MMRFKSSGRQPESVGQGARRHLREIIFRGRQASSKCDEPARYRQPAASLVSSSACTWAPFRQLADNVVEHVGRGGGETVAQNVGRDRLHQSRYPGRWR